MRIGFAKWIASVNRFILTPLRGVQLLIGAFNGSKEARLYICGRNMERDYGPLVKNPNIEFKGEMTGTQKTENVSPIDALVVPSLWFENSPLTIHEAFMFKKVVITANIGGRAELVKDGENGRLFRAGDVKDLQRTIEQCIRNPKEVTRMGMNAMRIKPIEENAAEMGGIYRESILRTQRSNSKSHYGDAG